jgi:hypothetical protein
MVSREIVGEVILVPIRQNVGDLESIFTLNETAGRAWALMDGEHTLGQIIEQIVSEFEVGSEEAQHDLFELLGQLQEIGAVLKV